MRIFCQDTVADSINKLWNRIPRKIKVTFFSCFAMGLITHVFMLTNKLPNLDDVTQTFSSLGSRVSSGRWFLGFATAISSTFSMPWVNGILCIVYISIAACFVVSLLKINQIIYSVLIAGLMISLPVVSATLTYMQSADAYFFSLLLACFAAFLAGRYKFGHLYAIIPLTFSTGIYQAYFGVAAGLLVLILIIDILTDHMPCKKTLIKGICFLGTLGGSMAMYFAVVKITTLKKGLNSYGGIDKMGQVSRSDLIYAMIRAYKSVAGYFIGNSRTVHYLFMEILFAASFLMCAGLIVLLCIKKKMHKEPVKLLFLAVLVILFPLVCNLIYVMSPQGTIHYLMIYGLVLVPVFLLTVVDFHSVIHTPDENEPVQKSVGVAGFGTILINQKNQKWISIAQSISCWIITLTAAMCIFNYLIFSNQVYFKQFFTYEKAYAQSIELISRIQMTEGYTSKTVVVFVGTPLYSTPNGTPELDSVIITGAVEMHGLYGTYSYPRFLQRYLNFTQPIEWVENGVLGDPDVFGVIDPEAAPIVEEMPEYPDDGSVALIGDKIYVKFNYDPE